MNTLDTSAFIGKFVEEARDRLKGLTAAVLVTVAAGIGFVLARLLFSSLT